MIAGLVSAGLAQANAWEQMRQLALSDPMTGLANRRAFDEHLRRHLGRTHTMRQPLALLLGDVNGLKRVNDRRGHAAGDDALLHVAAAAAAVAADVREALAVRLGGDEFAVILPGTSPQTAMDLGTRWCHDAAHPAHGTTLACGLAVAGPDTGPTDARDLLRAADNAQYRAKATGSPLPMCADAPDDLLR